MSVGKAIYNRLQGDKYIWFILALLTIGSMLAVYSAAGSLAFKGSGSSSEYYLVKHFLIIALGFGCTFICYKLHYMQYSKLAPIFFLIAIFLLIYTQMFGAEINDARRWLTIPIIRISFQTSDFAKLALIIFVARSISKKQDHIKDLHSAFVPVILPVILICGLIAPSDLSTALLLFLTCVIMMFVGRVHLKYIFALVALGVVALGLLIFIGGFFPETVRVATWITRLQEFMGNSEGAYQVKQSLIAIADGEWLGKGPGNSDQRDYLPYAYADFIYAIICEEYGLIGGITVIGLFLGLLLRCSSIVAKCPKAFGAMLAIGLALNLVIQAFANIAVSVNLVPVTGLTLPLVSMGGTSILFASISLGIILSVSKYIEGVQKSELNEQVLMTNSGSFNRPDNNDLIY